MFVEGGVLRSAASGHAVSSAFGRQAAVGFAVVFATVLLASLFGILTRPVGFLAAVWPANAILIGLMVRWPRFARLPNWLAAFLGYVAADLLTGGTLIVTLWLTAANMTGAMTGVALFRYVSDEDRHMHRPLSVLVLLAICIAAATAAAICGSGAAGLLFDRGVLDGLEFWFVTELVNGLVVLPVLLTFPARPQDYLRSFTQLGAAPERLVALAPLATLAASVALGLFVGGPGAIAFAVPALVWCALTYSVFGTALITAMLCATLLIASSTGMLAMPATSDFLDATNSIRLGIALIAIGPLTVSTVNRAREDLLAELSHTASHDALTGVLSRRAFMEQGYVTVSRLSPTGTPVSLLMFDIDHFKHVNDEHGHAAGDQALVMFAGLVRERLRPGDLFGRLGGEEFAVMMPGIPLGEALAVAERIRSVIERADIEASPGITLNISVSIGVSVVDAASDACLDRLLARSDYALYGAKASGRNTVKAAA